MKRAVRRLSGLAESATIWRTKAGDRLNKSILIVDDNAAIRNAVKAVFEEADEFEIVGEAVNGKDALEKAQILQPKVVILDLSMPVMNGLDAARKLREIQPETIIVMFTSFETQALAKAARQAGCDAIVSKPDLCALAGTVGQLLGRRDPPPQPLSQ